MFSPVFIYGLGAGIPAVVAEYLYRQWPTSEPWWHGLWMWAPLQLCIGFCIYKLVTQPNTTLLDSLVVFAGCTAGLRILASFMLGDTIRASTWAAFGLVMLANVVRSFWR